jgi:hypothetical protein
MQAVDRVIDENALPLGNALAGKGAPSAVKTGTRKAFGNLTNAAAAPGASTVGKQRRAFGELRSIAKTDGKPSSAPQPAPVTASGGDRISKLAEQYAAGGIEQLAGKGWHQLEKERHRREEEELQASARRMTSNLTSWSVKPVRGRACASAVAGAPILLHANNQSVRLASCVW